MCGMGVEYILKNSLLRRSLDNVTVVIIAFSNFKHTVFGHSSEKKEKESEQKVLDKRPVSYRVGTSHYGSGSTASTNNGHNSARTGEMKPPIASSQSSL